MKKTVFLTAALMLGTAALADTPNRVTMSFPEFVQAHGCVIGTNDAGQSNIYAASGGNCPVNVAALYAAAGSGTLVDTDLNPATDPVWVNDEN